MLRRRVVRTVLLTLLAVVVTAHLAYLGVVGVLSLHYRTHNPTRTALMRYREPADGVARPPAFLPLTELPAILVRSVIFIEDYDFYRHPGFDLESIRFAVELNARLGYRAYGGSTLTQQLARTLYLVPDKTYARKYLELLAALALEVALTKDRILELYLNTAEWGVGVYGVADAARTHFGKLPSQLDPDQVARLVTILASPRRYTVATFESNVILTRRYEAIRRYIPHVAATRLHSEIRRVDRPGQ